MRLRFLGTRGEIDVRTPRHRRHSALLVNGVEGGVMVDCGRDWRGELERLGPVAVVLTHAHPDHAGGLVGDLPCPVFATRATWGALRRRAVERPRTIAARRPYELAGLSFEAFPVEHSIRAPAVGYRIGDGAATIFYAPDLVAIEDEAAALAGIDLYVGDGAAITRSIVRRRDGRRIGHASIRAQLAWCEAAGVPRAVFTHCGTEIVGGDPGAVEERVRALGRERGLDAALAHDGLEITLGRADAGETPGGAVRATLAASARRNRRLRP